MTTSQPQGNVVNVNDVVDQAKIGRFHWNVIGLCGLVAMLDGFDTQSIAFVAPVISDEWGLAKGAFGVIFSAGLIGIMIGQLIFGPVADKFGRRKVILFCTFLFGVCTLANVTATDWTSLLTLRVATGIGLGGATPNIIALTSEYAPRRLRATMIAVMFGGFPIGAAVGGYISSLLIPAFGWQAVFYLGGVIPLVLLIALARALPESIQHLVAAAAPRERIARLLSRIRPDRRPTDDETFVLTEKPTSEISVALLFRSGRTSTTLLIWVAYFMSLLMIYFLMSWLPSVMRESGLTIGAAIQMAVFLNLGGAFGGVVLGLLVDRFSPAFILAGAYALAGACIAVIGITADAPMLRTVVVFAAGFCIIGGQTALHAIPTGLYPTQARATGVGAALAIGRAGSVLGPLAGGALLANELDIAPLFAIAALPSVFACLAILSLRSAIAKAGLNGRQT